MPDVSFDNLEPSISIIVPVYNAENYLEKCFDSINCQTFKDFECILIDDFSSDSSLNICNKYATEDNRFKVICNTENIGSSFSRKKGLDNSKGKYIYFIDSDDWIKNNMLEKMFAKASAENLDMVYCDYYRQRKHEGEFLYYKVTELTSDDIENIRNIVLSFGGHYLWNRLVKKEMYNNVEFYRESMSEDRITTTQLLYYISKTGYINEGLYYYRHNLESLSRQSDFKTAKNRYIESKKNFDRIFAFFKKNYGDLKQFNPDYNNRVKWLKQLRLRPYKELIKNIFISDL